MISFDHFIIIFNIKKIILYFSINIILLSLFHPWIKKTKNYTLKMTKKKNFSKITNVSTFVVSLWLCKFIIFTISFFETFKNIILFCYVYNFKSWYFILEKNILLFHFWYKHLFHYFLSLLCIQFHFNKINYINIHYIFDIII